MSLADILLEAKVRKRVDLVARAATRTATILAISGSYDAAYKLAGSLGLRVLDIYDEDYKLWGPYRTFYIDVEGTLTQLKKLKSGLEGLGCSLSNIAGRKLSPDQNAPAPPVVEEKLNLRTRVHTKSKAYIHISDEDEDEACALADRMGLKRVFDGGQWDDDVHYNDYEVTGNPKILGQFIDKLGDFKNSMVSNDHFEADGINDSGIEPPVVEAKEPLRNPLAVMQRLSDWTIEITVDRERVDELRNILDTFPSARGKRKGWSIICSGGGTDYRTGRSDSYYEFRVPGTMVKKLERLIAASFGTESLKVECVPRKTGGYDGIEPPVTEAKVDLQSRTIPYEAMFGIPYDQGSEEQEERMISACTTARIKLTLLGGCAGMTDYSAELMKYQIPLLKQILKDTYGSMFDAMFERAGDTDREDNFYDLMDELSGTLPPDTIKHTAIKYHTADYANNAEPLVKKMKLRKITGIAEWDMHLLLCYLACLDAKLITPDGKPMNAFVPEPPIIESKLHEASFRRLLQYTQQNGRYRIGGMRRINGSWVYDPTVPGRIDNSRFVISKPPRPHLDKDGYLVIEFSFKSRPDRCTSGLRHNGSIKLMPDKRASYQSGLKAMVKCSCLAGESLVLMHDGTYKQIKDIVVGDMVVTHRGRVRPVTMVANRSLRDDENVYEVKAQGFPKPFVITGEHPVYALRGYEYCACGCGAELELSKGRNAWSPEVMLKHKCVQGHGGHDPTVDRGKKHVRPYTKVRNCKTTEDFVSNAKLVHGDKYRYDGSEFLAMKERILINCPEHGDFKQLVRNHLSGRGCSKCAREWLRKCSIEQGKRRVKMPDIAPSFKWVKMDDIRSEEWLLSPWIEHSGVSVNRDFAKLVGYYASEGCMAKTGTAIILTLNTNEWDTLGADIMGIANRLGFPSKRTRSKIGNWFNITVYNKEFREFCKQHVGCGSHKKRLSSAIMSWDADSLTSLACGMVAGDGSVSGPRARVRYFSVSLDLVTQLSHILSILKLRNSVSYSSKPDKRRTYFNKRDKKVMSWVTSGTYQVSFSAEASWHFTKLMALHMRECQLNAVPCPPRTRAVKYEPEYGQLRHINVKNVDHEGLVYDISVDEDESFVVHGVVVHNCQDFKYRWQFALAEIGAAPRGMVDRPPVKTNPTNAPSLCKHCATMGSWMTRNQKDIEEWQKKITQWQNNDSAVRPSKPGKPQKVNNDAEVGDVPLAD